MNTSEDKTCRMCGFVDTRNVNIFERTSNTLLQKILTIFPITIYKSDPLPKNICRRCITNVSLIYEETQKVLRIQNGWIDNVRANQPNHSYVNILDIIERSNHDMVNNIRTFIADFSVYEPRSTYNFLEGENSNNDYSNYIHPNSSDHHHTNMICDTKENEDIKDVKLFDNITITESSLLDSNITDTNISNTLDQNFTVISNQNIENNLQEIQYKLQSNGCSLVTINNSSTSNFQISQSSSSSSLSASSSSKCRLCKKLFPNQKLLAKHQIQHLIITDRKLYITKYLQKKLRRGKIGPKKYIRCLNCWKLFADNFSIVNHWSKSQCDFYCTICGLEFPYNPQLLREHVFKEHGINYKFSKPPEIHIENVIPKFVVRDMFNKTTTPFIPQTITNSSKPKRKQSTTTNGGRVSCAICFCSFPNFQSKNAHMRKHKNYSIKNKTTTTQSSINQNHHYQTVDKQNVKIENINVENHLEILMEIKSETNTEKNSVKPKLQVKKLSDLQNPPPASSSTSSLSSSSRVTQNDDYQHYNYFDHMRHRRSFVCHPCGRMFTTNAALYEHSKYCQMSYKYSCHFCFKDFYTSPDLQMHVVLMHRNN